MLYILKIIVLFSVDQSGEILHLSPSGRCNIIIFGRTFYNNKMSLGSEIVHMTFNHINNNTQQLGTFFFSTNPPSPPQLFQMKTYNIVRKIFENHPHMLLEQLDITIFEVEKCYSHRNRSELQQNCQNHHKMHHLPFTHATVSDENV